ncbi:MAG TPA: hypothetical protein VMJ10_09665 [Kofleriaceae bacterium]|nr:hypothetical protein [Kofleriaceae bacterium]
MQWRLVSGLLVATTSVASADDPSPDATPTTPTTPVRREDATFGQIFGGPFQSSRLFAMPTADTVGPYMLALSGEGSLLEQPGLLTSAGVVAIGFGDLAQLEYRHTEAISVTGVNAPVPAVGAQFRLPIPEQPNVPAIGIAYRQGLPRDEQVGMATVEESVTDIYMVARERLSVAPWLTLHAGLRYSPSHVTVTGLPAKSADLWLPAAGFELAVNREARVVGETELVPQFHFDPGDTAPRITTGAEARLGLRWALFHAVTLDASFGYQLDEAMGSIGGPRDVVQEWDIRLGAEVFVPWGALACRAAGVFCD